MPDDTENIPDTPGEETPPAPIVQPIVETPAANKEQVHQLKDSDFKKVKDKARAQGRADATEEMENAAKAAGFDSMADAFKTLAAVKAGKANETPSRAAPQVTTDPEPDDQETDMPTPKPDPKIAAATAAAARAARDRDALATENADTRKRWRAEERERRRLQRELEAKDAEIALRTELHQLGVQDVDYTLRLLTRELEGKTEEDLGKFDRAAWATKLREEKPYLFGEVRAAATTGTTGGSTGQAQPGANGQPPGPPAAGDAAARDAAQQQFNARDAKPADVSARLRQLGLNPLH